MFLLYMIGKLIFWVHFILDEFIIIAGCLDDDVTESNNNNYWLTVRETNKLKLILIK